MTVKKELSKDLEERRALIEQMVNIKCVESAAKFFDVSPVFFLDLKKEFPKMPFEQTKEGFYCTDTIEMLRFWVAYSRAFPRKPYKYIPWLENHPLFKPFMEDIPPIDYYR